jgi:hypothetical protein
MKSKALRIAVIASAALVALAAAGLGWMLLSISSSVRETIRIAQRDHPRPKDDLGALVAYLDSGTHALKERELAIWTLGRLRDARALPALEKYYTGRQCDHRTTICQYELVKALRLCGTAMPIHDKEWYRKDR